MSVFLRGSYFCITTLIRHPCFLHFLSNNLNKMTLFSRLCRVSVKLFLSWRSVCFQDVYQDFAASILQVCDTPYDARWVKVVGVLSPVNH